MKVEIVDVESEKYPIAMYKPYIWAKITDLSSFYVVDTGKKVEIIDKRGNNEQKKRNKNNNRKHER